MASIRKAYEKVNATWPAEVPNLTGPEAVRAAKRLYRFAMGETWAGPVEVTSGNRYSYIRWSSSAFAKTLFVNPDNGWRRMIHDLSHDLYRRANGYDDRPHNKDHARVERMLINEVVKRGWLDGRLKDKPKAARTREDTKLDKLVAIDKRIEVAERKIRLAAAALKRLHTKRRAIVRAFVKPESTTGGMNGNEQRDSV